MITATAVADSYQKRAGIYRAETANVRRPRLLRGLLDTARQVAEVPCGTGHFLADYASARVAVTLVDVCPEMLAAASDHAGDIGLPGEKVRCVLSTVQRLPALTGVDLVVIPNGALNQLVCQGPLALLLARLRSALRPGAAVLTQVACTHSGNGADSSTFYDPRCQHGVWFMDRWLIPTRSGEAVLRRRRQHRDGDTLRIEFDYRDPIGERRHAAEVELELLSASGLADAFTTAGFVHARFLPGHGGLSELLVTTPDRGPR